MNLTIEQQEIKDIVSKAIQDKEGFLLKVEAVARLR